MTGKSNVNEKRRRQNRESQRRYRERHRALNQQSDQQPPQESDATKQTSVAQQTQSSTTLFPNDQSLFATNSLNMRDYCPDLSDDTVYHFSDESSYALDNMFDTTPTLAWTPSQTEKPTTVLPLFDSPPVKDMTTISSATQFASRPPPIKRHTFSPSLTSPPEQQCTDGCHFAAMTMHTSGEQGQNFCSCISRTRQTSNTPGGSVVSELRSSLEGQRLSFEQRRTSSHGGLSSKSARDISPEYSAPDRNGNVIADRLMSDAVSKLTELEYLFKFGVTLGLLKEDRMVSRCLTTAKRWFIRTSESIQGSTNGDYSDSDEMNSENFEP